jgi:Flp pilus assembly protein TadG
MRMFGLVKRMATAHEAVAAVEFALIAPVLIVMFFGLVELSNGFVCLREVSNMASSAANLVAQSTQISGDDETNIFAALSATLYPNPTTGTTIILTSIADDGHGNAKVAWSDALNGTAHTVGAVMTVPSGLIPTGGSVIFAEVTYVYQSPASVIITGPITMTRSSYALPRLATQVARVP